MASLGSFILLSPSASSGGGGGGTLPTVITVPGNAAAIVARAIAADALFEAVEVDADTVEVTFPVGLSVEELFEMSNQMNYVFGTLGEDDLGWMTVTAKGVLGLADGADTGPDPDYVPVVGTIKITSGLSRPVRILSTGQFLVLSEISATFDSDGELFFGGNKNVRLVAPQWAQLSNTTWRWSAEFKPGPGQNWQSFIVTFTGAPGDVINLATLIP